MNELDEPMPMRHRIVWAVLMLVIAGLIGAAIYKRMNRGRGPGARPVERILPEFNLADQSAKPFGSKELSGKVWIASFVFTQCSGSCPMIMSKLQDVDSKLDDLPDVQLISLTMDPEHDTSEVLACYAKTYNINSPRWRFLTGPRDVIHRLTRDGFKLAVEDHGPPDEPILHSNKLVLVDGSGVVRGYFDSTSGDELRNLLFETRKLAKAQGKK